MKLYQKITIILHVFVLWCHGVYNNAVFRREGGTNLANNVINTKQRTSEAECGILCSKESSCVSVNYKKSGSDKGKCELNDKLMEDSEENKERNSEFDYLEIVQRVRRFSLRVNCKTK